MTFNAQTPLKALNTTIKSLFDDAGRCLDDDVSLAISYFEDAKELIKASQLVRQNKIGELSNFIDEMDTMIREYAVCALNKDLGAEFVINSLGYEVA
jgi:hypothetical protein